MNWISLTNIGSIVEEGEKRAEAVANMKIPKARLVFKQLSKVSKATKYLITNR